MDLDRTNAILKFTDPVVTADGSPRAHVAFTGLDTLWFNTGTLCNLTGGEPFMNPDMIAMAGDALAAGFRVLILTNAMKPMQHVKPALAALHAAHPGKLSLRVSLDGYRQHDHEDLRGPRSWAPTLEGLTWLVAQGFDISVAGRTIWGEDEPATRAGSVMCANSRMVVKAKGRAAPHVVSCTLLPYADDFDMGATLADASKPVALNHRFCAQFCVLGGASCSA